MMAGDANPFHNYTMPTDVNGDQETAPLDVILVVDALQQGGSRQLGGLRSLSASSEGESGGDALMVDVNGDGYVSPLDVLLVSDRLQAEGEGRGQFVRFRLTARDPATRQPITQVTAGQDFLLRVTVQDLRAASQTVLSPGVFGAFLDVLYDPAVVQVKNGPTVSKFPNANLGFAISYRDPDSPFQPGTGFDEFVFPYSDIEIKGQLTGPADQDAVQGPLPLGAGVINEVGGVANTTNRALANEKFVFEVTMTAAAVNAVDDLASIPEDTPTKLAVLTNDTLPSGSTQLAGNPSDFVPSSQVVVYSRFKTDPGAVDPNCGAACDGDFVVSPNEQAFVNASLQVAPNGGTLRLEDVTAPAGHTAVIDRNGTPGILSDDTVLFTPAADFSGQVTLTYTVSDSQGHTDTANVTVTVNPVNDAPVLTPASPSRTTNEDTAIVAALTGFINGASGTTTITDVDAGATIGGIAIVGINGRGVAAFSVNGGLSFTSIATPPSPSAALLLPRDAQLRYTPDGLSGEAATIQYRAWDQTSGSPGGTANVVPNGGSTAFSTTTDTLTINVTDVNNDPPVATDLSLTVNNVAPTTRTFPVDDPDADDSTATLVYTITQPTDGNAATGDGTVVNNNNGTFTFNPGNDFLTLTAGQQRVVTFQVFATDSHAQQSNTATITLTVIPNNPPNAVDDAFSTTETTSISGNLFANNGGGADSDVENDPFTVTAFDSLSVRGATVIAQANGSFTYNPANSATLDALAQGQQLVDTFTYTITDSQSGSDTATVSVTVTGVNDAPDAKNDSVSTNEDTQLNGNVRSNNGGGADVDPDTNDTLTVTLAAGGNVTHGTLTLNADGSFSYTPATNYFGPDSFSYVLSDGRATDTATVSITVTAVNDAPVASNVQYTVSREGPATRAFSATDVDDAASALVYSIVAGPGAGNGTVAVNTGGTFTFTPGSDFSALQPGQSRTVTFTYRATDAGNAPSNTATASITVVANNLPDVKSDAFSTTEPTSISGNVFQNNGSGADTDVENDPFSVSSFDATSTRGAAVNVLANGNFTYNPSGSANLNALAEGQVVTDTFTYTVTQQVAGQPGGSATATVTVTVTGVNDAPVANDATTSMNEDTTLNGDAKSFVVDPDTNDTLTFRRVANVAHGTLTLNTNGTFSYVPSTNFFGQDSFSFEVSDGRVTDTAVVTLNVVAVNDAPTAASDSFLGLKNGGTQTFNLVTNDTAGPANENTQTLSIASVTNLRVTNRVAGPNNAGTFTLDGGTIKYTPATDFEGTVEFDYVVQDNGSPILTATSTGKIEILDFLDNSISGKLYVDLDRDGHQDSNEIGIAGVPVTLSGLDKFGRAINFTLMTDSNGRYQFDRNTMGGRLAPGADYRITAGQGKYFVDGAEHAMTPHGASGAMNTAPNQFTLEAVPNVDQFKAEIGLFGGASLVADFTEYGLPAWINFDTVASDSEHGFVCAASMASATDQYWQAILNESGIRSVKADLRDGFSAVHVTVVDANGTSHTRTINMNTNFDLRLLGKKGDDVVLRYDGTLQEFLRLSSNQRVPLGEGEGPSEQLAYAQQGSHDYATAADRVFSEESWA